MNIPWCVHSGMTNEWKKIHAGEGDVHGLHYEWAKNTDIINLGKEKKVYFGRVISTLILSTITNSNEMESRVGWWQVIKLSFCSQAVDVCYITIIFRTVLQALSFSINSWLTKAFD